MMKYFNFLSGETEQYDTYYISDNGTDKSTCGKTEYSGCKSLKNVLSVYYNKTQAPLPGLSIVVSKSLTIKINQQLVVS